MSATQSVLVEKQRSYYSQLNSTTRPLSAHPPVQKAARLLDLRQFEFNEFISNESHISKYHSNTNLLIREIFPLLQNPSKFLLNLDIEQNTHFPKMAFPIFAIWNNALSISNVPNASFMITSTPRLESTC
ncbi:hypothetical protein CEXT_721701 [Caerostris extrusa]|uniref:Uncharacterized protein n=1 Tax=Caerostris extrusa TaxID=172846 RepID=A0AAV4XMX5_CAEEX|nr:hypothetical protein CEXT_721701 [Caerostris extrusa]